MPRKPVTVEGYFLQRISPRGGITTEERALIRGWFLDLGGRLEDQGTTAIREKLRALFGKTFWGLLEPTELGSGQDPFRNSREFARKARRKLDFLLESLSPLRGD